MFSGSSPKKRKAKHHKSDDDDGDDVPSCSTKRQRQDSQQANDGSIQEKSLSLKQEDERNIQIRRIVSREFVREMKSKEAQLELVDERLAEAKNLLERLRYAIVAEYYKKQELTQTMIDAAVILDENTETMTGSKVQVPQIPLHPSVKKIIGKRPQSLAEIMRACPKRAAAKNANHVLNTNSATELREERRLQKVIREKGIVIDHSKENLIKAESDTQNSAQFLNSENKSDQPEVSSTHILNKTRTCKKHKCHFVVGNTSKYIGKIDERIPSNSNTPFSHKWLVYVQTKDTDVPIEKYVKKVRFFLHPSYRPNDIIDIHEPPFQVARRGWGEFPMRIQLYFHDIFHQKPLQLIHEVVLDTTKSGRHTLGSETIVEIWLRNEATTSTVALNVKHENRVSPKASITTAASVTSTATGTSAGETSRKPRTISFNMKETFDDNFFDFLNKIEESRTSICADIEKIEPTLLVNEPLEPQFSNTMRSPIKKELLRSPLKQSPVKNTLLRLTPPQKILATNERQSLITQSLILPKAIKAAASKLSAVINQKELLSKKQEQEEKLVSDLQNPSTLQVATTILSPPIIVTTKSNLTANNTNNIITSPGKVFNNVSGTIILPVTKKQNLPLQLNQNPNSTTQIQSNTANNAIFQKKTIQILNAHGQIKTIQMVVGSTKSTIEAATSSKTNAIGQQRVHLNPYLPKTNLTPTTNSKHAISSSSASFQQLINTKTNNAIRSIKPLSLNNVSKNVFQKEGKLFIIDPMQIKLKQQRKNQVSLLKPQIKLPQNQQPHQQKSTANLHSITSDHDYTSSPPLMQRNSLSISCNQSSFQELTPPVHFGLRETRLSTIKEQDKQKWQRLQFERKFSNSEFGSMRSAVEYLLRRLPLINAKKESPASAFLFVKATAQEFHSLPAFKQRSCEWLRAKFIARVLRNSKSLQSLQATGIENFWSTREIATFARYYAYTPSIKTLQPDSPDSPDSETVPGSKEHFTALIKTEMKNEQLHLEYDSLSSAEQVSHWLYSTQDHLQNINSEVFTDDIIIIDDDDREDQGMKEKTSSEDVVTNRIYGSPLKYQNNGNNLTYLPPPARLETAFEYVSDICKDISARLRPEEIVPGIVHPSAQIALSHVAQLFVERLLRQTIADQTLHQQKQYKSSSQLPHNSQERAVTSQDIRKTISQYSEFDFLTNKHLGVASQRIKNE